MGYMQDQTEAGVIAAMNILDKWQCSEKEKQQLLGLMEGVPISTETIERVSYILNIHASLRTIFDNPENYYGWPRLRNRNHEQTPLQFMLEGGIEKIKEVSEELLAWISRG